MDGDAVNQACTLSRRSRYSSSMRVTGSCGPVSAARAAFCVIDAMFDVECPCTVLHAVVTTVGAIVQPQRQPVIAYAFDAEPARIVRSRIRSNSTRGRLCGSGS